MKEKCIAPEEYLVDFQSLNLCEIVAENERYRFLKILFTIVREDKVTGLVTYFSNNAGMACIYKNRLYWSEGVEIGANHYLCRRNIDDGQDFERMNVLSNLKTYATIGRQRHRISEDTITDMAIEDSSLILTVSRSEKNPEEYQLQVYDDGKKVYVMRRIIPDEWEVVDEDIEVNDYFKRIRYFADTIKESMLRWISNNFLGL